ncbi:hypothetical protein BKA82DRAFT_33291 [Pisolithus tinctorius]|nr:hypothetical protein BKA82DRAFT_33291 [Pisolithus tinctorius]
MSEGKRKGKEKAFSPGPSQRKAMTPLQRRETSTASYRMGNLTSGRKAVLKDLGRILVVPLDSFKSTTLHPLREQINISNIKALALRGGRFQRLRAVFKTDPKQSVEHEEEAFQPLSKIFTAVVNEGEKATGQSPRLAFHSLPTKSPVSERTNTSRPDAFLAMVNKKSIGTPPGVQSWEDIAVSFEFKKSDGNAGREEYGRTKRKFCGASIILCGAIHVAVLLAFCVTIENTQTRFWYTCRAATLVSMPFDIMTEPEHLIYFFCALTFADDDELGWDPTTQRVVVGGKVQYNISVQPDEGGILVYQTIRPISTFGADALMGRGTRTWEAIPLSRYRHKVTEPQPVVLKDSWRDSNRDREDTIRDQILNAMGEKKGEAEKYFLTVVAAGDVVIGRLGMKDTTISLLRGAHLPESHWHQLRVDEELKGKIGTSVGLYPILLDEDGVEALPPGIQHCTHSRVVFAEVGQTIYELGSLSASYGTLQYAREGLQLMHDIGWVHRDVSPGNVLRVGNQGKIADLDYSKHMHSDTTHDIRTVSKFVIHQPQTFRDISLEDDAGFHGI